MVAEAVSHSSIDFNILQADMSSNSPSYISSITSSNSWEATQCTRDEAERPAKKQKLTDGTTTQATAIPLSSRFQGPILSGPIAIRGRTSIGRPTAVSTHVGPSTPAVPGRSGSTIPSSQPITTDSSIDSMSDGRMSARSSQATASANREAENEARALRVLEIMNDFRTLQVHITSLTTRAESSPPDQSVYYLDGYVVLRQCSAEAQAILATHYNPGNLGIEPGQVSDSEKQKATLQRYAQVSK